MLIYGFSHSMAHLIFFVPYMVNYKDKADKLDLKPSTRRPFKSRDLAFSREVNRQGQRNWAIHSHILVYESRLEKTYLRGFQLGFTKAKLHSPRTRLTALDK